MHILPPAIEIGENEGFDPQKDIFGRKAFGEDLKRLFENVEDPLVAILDAPWGSGKTVFAKMWCGMMRNEGFPVIYFDAFANDYMDDAFLCLASEIIEVSNKDKTFSKSAKEKFVEFSKKAGKALIKASAKAGIKALTFNFVDRDDLEEIKSAVSDFSKEAEAELEKYIERKFAEYGKEKHFFESFRKALKELVESREEVETTPQTADDIPDAIPPNRPLIIVIDELDRCRPPFALELLEKIKHFFSVPGVHFLLVTHLDQFSSVIRHSYGINEFSDEYLQKFYHVSIVLPENDDVDRSDGEVYARKLIKNAGIPLIHEKATYIIETMLSMISYRKLTFRSIEQVVARMMLVFASGSRNSLLIVEIISGLCIIKVTNHSLYSRIKNGENVLDEICRFLGYGVSNNLDFEENWWKYCYSTEVSDQISSQAKYIAQYGVSRDKLISYMCKRIDMISLKT